jgi:gluconate 2-dehydrogenase gamma chain
VTDLSRREALLALGTAPLAGLLDWSAPGLARARRLVDSLAGARPGAGPGAAAYTPKFFSAHEWHTVRVLADLVIPRDERSGSATDAKAPEFVDFMLAESDTSERTRIAMHGGLAWLDTEMRRRFGHDFLTASAPERTALLDDIAYPARARPEFHAGSAWFDQFRDRIGGAFFSSAIGWQDLRYLGNVFNPGWNGCPPPALDKLGVSYAEFDASLAARRNR